MIAIHIVCTGGDVGDSVKYIYYPLKWINLIVIKLFNCYFR